MKYLLDTHIFLWWVLNHPKLSKNAEEVISNPLNEIFLSAASTWEMMIKSNIGKLSLPNPPEIFVKNQMIQEQMKLLNITVEHIFALAGLPMFHKDPFDRMLIAQAISENMILITDDELIQMYSVKSL